MERHGPGLRNSRGRKALIALGAAVLATAALVPMGAFASHGDKTLPGSNFEIDDNANLVVDHASPSIDWASVDEDRRTDLPTGQSDNSYSGGTKEDDSCPGTTTGSIPNNKSDLLTFGAYQERTLTGPGFLHMFWSRVAEPSGTTVMDFELNKSNVSCSNGVNKIRNDGDLLIEYLIEAGGANATIKVRKWAGSAWGTAQDLTGLNPPLASGTINSSAILPAASDGLGGLQARTFGELTLDLNFVLNPNSCTSFGSAFLKSRASTSFTSQLKDFIAPVPVTVSNCAKVVIRKQTTPDEDPNTTTFGFTKSFSTDPSTTNTFTLKDDESQAYTTVLPGSGYTVVEDTVPTGWTLEGINCGASTGVIPSINGATVTFAIDSPGDVLDCTYTNKASGAIVITKTRKHAAAGPGDHPHAGVTFTVTGGSLPAAGATVVTDAQGNACVGGLALGNYTVTETVPTGYTVDANPKSVTVADAGTCTTGRQASVTFKNMPLTNITVSVDSQIDGGTSSTITCGSSNGTTGSNGDGSLTISNKEPGTYTCTILVDP